MADSIHGLTIFFSFLKKQILAMLIREKFCFSPVYFSPVFSGTLALSESSGSMIASVHTLVVSACCASFNIIAMVVMGTSFGQHGTVFYFRFPQSRAVAGGLTNLLCLV